jgi:hypothetical protein
MNSFWMKRVGGMETHSRVPQNESISQRKIYLQNAGWLRCVCSHNSVRYSRSSQRVRLRPECMRARGLTELGACTPKPLVPAYKLISATIIWKFSSGSAKKGCAAAAWHTHTKRGECVFARAERRRQPSRFLCARTQFNLAAVAEFRQETITIGITVASAHNLRGSRARNYVRGSDLLSQIAFNLVLVWPGCVRLHCALI